MTRISQPMNWQRRLSLAVAIFATAFSLAGASCSKQDPLAGQPDNIRNGVPPSEKGDDRGQAASEEMLRIRSADFVTFQEGVEGKTVITGAYLQGLDGREPVLGQDFVVEIANLSDFPGATYDMQSGEFKWTPAEGYTLQNYTKNASLTVRIATTAAPVLGKEFQMLISVTRAKIVPEVLSIDFDKSAPIREGEQGMFTVKVRDRAAINQDNMRPRLVILSGNASNSSTNVLASAIRQTFPNPTVDAADPQVYTFKMSVDLRDRELTKTKDVFNFSVQAVNRYGEASSSLSKSVTVVTSLRDPMTTLGDAIEVVRGQYNTINFSVYDPYNESYMAIDFDRCGNLGGDTKCECVTSRSQGATSTENCTIIWKPLATQKLGIVDKEISISQKTKVTDDTILPKTLKRIVRMNVVAAADEAQPTPAPTPAPASGGAQ